MFKIKIKNRFKDMSYILEKIGGLYYKDEEEFQKNKKKNFVIGKDLIKYV